jgi:serine/threonine protein kinase
MGAIYEVLAPSTERGTRLDLTLQRMRNPTTVGRVHLSLPSGSLSKPGVMREVDVPRDEALDRALGLVGDTFYAYNDPVFVSLLRVVRSVEGSSVGVVCEYTEGTTGRVPGERSARVRAVKTAGLSLIDSLARLSSNPARVHGGIKPSNLLFGARSSDGTGIPVCVFDLGMGAIARTLVERAARDTPGGSLEAAFVPAMGFEQLTGSVLTTATTWGSPGYVPIGHFAEATLPTHATDLFGTLVSLWEMLSGTPLISLPNLDASLPSSTRSARLTLASDAAWSAFVSDTTRRDRLRASLTHALGNVHPGAVGNWVDCFDDWITRGASDPSVLNSSSIRRDLELLPDPNAISSTLQVSAEDAPDIDFPSVITLSAGKEYRAEVVLDYFSVEEGADVKARTLRFRHISMLGEGAMGSVHRVEVIRTGDTSLPAALKLAVDDSVHNREALLREAHVLRAQRLDGMTQFLALLELPGGSLALLMSYQPGAPLDSIIQQRRITAAEALILGKRLLGTLVALHADATPDDPAEVVHGDIKPGNIIVPIDAHNRPDFAAAVLIDFGVSRLRLRIAVAPSTTTDATTNQVLGGTTGYMPQGHLTRGATPSSDVFAVSVVLYEALTGRMPWRVESAEKFSPFGLAFATEKIMKERDASHVSWREVPPWRRRRGWDTFFQKSLGHGDPDRIPAAREALTLLDGIRRDYSFVLVACAVLAVFGLAGARWFQTSYCPQSQIRCDGVCTDISHSEVHCGACGHSCVSGEVCRNSACITSCSDGLTECDRVCRDLQSDLSNCGACGQHCASGQVCSSGSCAASCSAGLTLCSSTCRDTRTDRAHCGRCDARCSAGQICTGGRCVTSCQTGSTLCGGVCRDIRTDRAHCGGCDRSCDAGRVCEGGRCVTSCTSGFTDCAGSCRDTATDRANCGACSRACGAGENCVRGVCRQECPPNLSLCGGRCRDTAVDSNHCGACGQGCAPGERCSDNRCTLSCPSGTSPCGSSCRDTSTDRAHCGACGNECSTGQICERGHCGLVCPNGQVVCGATCTDPGRDEDHCGSCERRCDRGQICESGRCTSSCGAGLTACGDRCRDIDTDEAACGACGRACGHGEACVNSTCRPLARAVVAPGAINTLPSEMILNGPLSTTPPGTVVTP